MTNDPPLPDRIIRRAEVLQLIGLSKTSLYTLIAAGKFPKPVRLSLRAVGWRERGVIEWVNSRGEGDSV